MEFGKIKYHEKVKMRGLHQGGENGRDTDVDYFYDDITEAKDFVFQTEHGDVNLTVDPVSGIISADYPLKGRENPTFAIFSVEIRHFR